MDNRVTEPSIRKPLGVLFILAIIMVWAMVVVAASPWIGALPAIVEALIYLIAGIVWILPLGPILRWMETGRFSR